MKLVLPGLEKMANRQERIATGGVRWSSQSEIRAHSPPTAAMSSALLAVLAPSTLTAWYVPSGPQPSGCKGRGIPSSVVLWLLARQGQTAQCPPTACPPGLPPLQPQRHLRAALPSSGHLQHRHLRVHAQPRGALYLRCQLCDGLSL